MKRVVHPKISKNPTDIVGDTLYYKLSLGREKIEVTKRMAEHISGAVEELGIKYQTGFIDYKEYRAELSNIKLGLYKDIGKSNVLFENIVERTGIIDVLLHGKVEVTAKGSRSTKGIEGKLSPQQFQELQRLVRNINIISRNRLDAYNFYKDISDVFKDISNIYEKYFKHGGNLTQDEIDDLVASAKLINEMAKNYV